MRCIEKLIYKLIKNVNLKLLKDYYIKKSHENNSIINRAINRKLH